MAVSSIPEPAIDAVCAFNRCYRRTAGRLDEHLADGPFSPTEAKVLYELAGGESVTASELVRELALDAGYLSRILARLEAAGLVTRRRAQDDARRSHAELTTQGRQAFAALDAGSRNDAATLLGALTRDGREALVGAMDRMRALLCDADRATTLRDLEPGDAGWIVERHGALYAAEFGYDATFEALVANIAAQYLERHDPARERAWIAERGGSRAGSVLLVRADDETAKLRLLIVEPPARGLGVGRALVDACTRFARAAGYRRITLWTQSHLAAARSLYEAAGYVRVAEAPHRSFGLDLVAETWVLELA